MQSLFDFKGETSAPLKSVKLCYSLQGQDFSSGGFLCHCNQLKNGPVLKEGSCFSAKTDQFFQVDAAKIRKAMTLKTDFAQKEVLQAPYERSNRFLP